MRMLTAFAAALATTLAVAGTSLAAEPAQRADAGAHGRSAKKFPMAGAEFKQHVDARIATARQRMETRIAQLPADKQREARARFDAGVQTVNAEVQRAIADNVVTKDEAKKVRDIVRSVRPHHGHHKPAAKK